MAVLYTPHFVQFFDTDGRPLAGGKLYTYEAGTTTPKATYTEEDGLANHPNPVIMDSSGIPLGSGAIFLSGSYKFRLNTAADVLVEETDNVTAFATGDSGVDDIVTNFTADTMVEADSIIFSDASDGNTTKRTTLANLVAATSDIISGTANKLVKADSLAPLYYSTKLYQTTGVSVPTATWTTLTFDTEEWDDGSWHSTSSNSERVTVDFSGRVRAHCSYAINSSANITIGIRFRKNGTVAAQFVTSTASTGGELHLPFFTADISVSANDYIDVQVFHRIGAGSTSLTGTTGTTLFVSRIR